MEPVLLLLLVVMAVPLLLFVVGMPVPLLLLVVPTHVLLLLVVATPVLLFVVGLLVNGDGVIEFKLSKPPTSSFYISLALDYFLKNFLIYLTCFFKTLKSDF